MRSTTPPEPEAHAIYRAYAPVYDAIGQARFGARLASWTLEWLEARAFRPARVLDLACGSGAAALVFAAAGCRVVGLDRSAAMLSIARARARDAGLRVALVHGDLRALPRSGPPTTGRRRAAVRQQSQRRERQPAQIGVSSGVRRLSVAGRSSPVVRRWAGRLGWRIAPASFDLVSCFYDSLNYLTADRDLERVFAGVRAALRPGGYLVCDLNTAAEYQTWDQRDTVVYDGRDYLVYNQLSYDPLLRLAEGRIVWFVRELERWWRGEEIHTQRAWSESELRTALEAAGLALVARLAPDGSPADADAPRIVWVARHA